MAFKAGDVVRTKCGGPKMTVEGPSTIYRDGANTVWFTKRGKLRRDTFMSDMLERVLPPMGKITQGGQ